MIRQHDILDIFLKFSLIKKNYMEDFKNCRVCHEFWYLKKSQLLRKTIEFDLKKCENYLLSWMGILRQTLSSLANDAEAI